MFCVGQVWRFLTSHLLAPQHPFELHVQLAKLVFADWPADALGRPPLWCPTSTQRQETNIARFLATFQVGTMRPPCNSAGSSHAAWWWCCQGSVKPGHPTVERYVQVGTDHCVRCMQGDALFQRSLTNDPGTDWYALQSLSWQAPHAVWPALLAHLGIHFTQPPQR